MRIFCILIRHLTYIVQQSGTLSLLRVQSELGSHHSTQVRSLAGVLQQVLSVAGTIFHLTHDADQFGMQTMNTQVDSRALTCLHNLVIKLLLYLGNNLLDACGMDATVTDQLVQSQTANLATHWIEGRNDDGLRSIIDDDFHSTGCLQSSYVTTLTTYDAAFDVVIINMEHRYAVFDGCLRSHTLDGLNHYLLSLSVGVKLRLIDNLVDIAGCIGTSLVLQAFHQTALGFLSAQAREFLQLGTLLVLHFLQFFLLDGQQFLLIIDALLTLLHFLTAATQLFLTLVERNLTLLQFVLTLLDALIALLNLFLEFTLLVQEFLLHFQQFLLFNHFSLFVGGCNHFIILSLDNITEKSIADESPYDEGYRGCNQ